MQTMKMDLADRFFSYWVRLRDKKCKRCGSPVGFNDRGLPRSHQCSHFVGRGKENTRFNPDNADTLCGGCHLYFTAHPMEHMDWQIAQKGQEVVDKLKMLSNLYCKKDRISEKIYWKKKLLQDFKIKV